jgi:hypothetical protein
MNTLAGERFIMSLGASWVGSLAEANDPEHLLVSKALDFDFFFMAILATLDILTLRFAATCWSARSSSSGRLIWVLLIHLDLFVICMVLPPILHHYLNY